MLNFMGDKKYKQKNFVELLHEESLMNFDGRI